MENANPGWGWWTVFGKMGDYERVTLNQICPNPSGQPLLEVGREYTPLELGDLLQRFGSYLASLHYQEALLEAKGNALKEAFKSAMQISLASSESKASTVSAREGEILAEDAELRKARKMQIENESELLLVKGWIASYDITFTTVSRLITLLGVDASLAAGRQP